MSELVQNKRYEAIDLIKVFLSIGIVLRHAELVSMAGRNQTYDYINQAGMFFSDLFVPMFFILSGFLFFRNAPMRFDLKFFTNKWKSRLFSLVIPYVIANCVAFVCYWLAYRYYPSMMDGFFGDSWRNPLFVFWTGPVNLSLWFIRDLIIAVLCAPLIWLFVRYTRIWGVVALGVLCFFVGMHPWYNFYFVIGAWVAMWGHDTKELCQKTGPWWLLVYFLIFSTAMGGDPQLRSLTLIPGFVLLIYAAEEFTTRTKIKIGPQWSAWCFFMYLYHYIPELALKKLFTNWIDPQSTMGLLFTFFAVSLITLLLVSGVYYILKKLLPKPLGVLVGGKL